MYLEQAKTLQWRTSHCPQSCHLWILHSPHTSSIQTPSVSLLCHPHWSQSLRPHFHLYRFKAKLVVNGTYKLQSHTHTHTHTNTSHTSISLIFPNYMQRQKESCLKTKNQFLLMNKLRILINLTKENLMHTHTHTHMHVCMHKYTHSTLCTPLVFKCFHFQSHSCVIPAKHYKPSSSFLSLQIQSQTGSKSLNVKYTHKV